MMTNEELSRLRKAFAAPARPAADIETCPPADRIWLAVRGELPADEMREIVDHIATCPSCAEDWRIAMTFEEEAHAVPLPQRTRSTRRAWMAAAATILVAVVGFLIPERTPEPPPGFRAGESRTVESRLEENARLPRQRFTLAWRDVPGAASYDLTVSKASNLSLLYEAKGLTGTTCTVPASALAGLRPGTKLYWAVTPVSRDGGQLQVKTSTVYVIDEPQ